MCIRDRVNTEQPTKRLEMIEVIQDENKFWTMQGWRDFLRGRKREVTLVGNEDDPVWWFNIEGSNDRFIVYDSVLEEENRIAIKTAGIHEKTVEEWMNEYMQVKTLSRDKEDWRRKYLQVEAEKEREITRRTMEGVKTIIKGIMEGEMGEQTKTEQTEV